MEDFWRWDPFREFSLIRDTMSDIFGDLFSRRLMPARIVWQPAMDIYRDGNNIVMETSLPGMKKEDVNISFDDGVLTVSGEMKEEKEKKEEDYYYKERRTGSFSRSVAMPEEINAEGIKAEMKDGVLKVTMPLKEQAKSKKVKIEIK